VVHRRLLRLPIGALVALVPGLLLAGIAAPATLAATPQCGSVCAALFNLTFGPADVTAVTGPSGTSARTGQPVALVAASGSNQGEDWVILVEGTVNDFFQAGIVSAGLNLHYSNDEVVEIDYAPFGTDSGRCMGVAGVAASGTSVSIQPCGVNASTLWIEDTADQQQRQVPLINGSDTNFSHPFVLTASSVGTTLTTRNLTSANGVIDDGQYWSSVFGVL
jgi:hypothetical protein